MRTRVVFAVVLGLLSAEIVRAQDPLIIPSRRLNSPTDEQFVWLAAEVNGDIDGFSSAHSTGVVGVAHAGTINSGGVLRDAQATGGSECLTVEGALSYGPAVNTFGSISGTVSKTLVAASGYSWQFVDPTQAAATFQIERHPTKDSAGSELGAPVTIYGRLIMAVYGGNSPANADVQLLAGRDAHVIVGTSFLDAVNWGATGWTVTGSLSQSSRANPTAPPLIIGPQNHGGGLNLDLGCSQVAGIGTIVPLFAQMNDFLGTINRTSGEAIGSHSLLWDYSFEGSYWVLDEEL